MENSANLNTMRLITKNILAAVNEDSSTIHWLNHS